MTLGVLVGRNDRSMLPIGKNWGLISRRSPNYPDVLQICRSLYEVMVKVMIVIGNYTVS